MKIVLSKDFEKHYRKLPKAQKERFKQVSLLFRQNHQDPFLNNHPLTGEWKGYRSISFGGDWRIHYSQINKDTALFVAIGTHSQLYK